MSGERYREEPGILVREKRTTTYNPSSYAESSEIVSHTLQFTPPRVKARRSKREGRYARGSSPTASRDNGHREMKRDSHRQRQQERFEFTLHAIDGNELPASPHLASLQRQAAADFNGVVSKFDILDRFIEQGGKKEGSQSRKGASSNKDNNPSPNVYSRHSDRTRTGERTRSKRRYQRESGGDASIDQADGHSSRAPHHSPSLADMYPALHRPRPQSRTVASLAVDDDNGEEVTTGDADSQVAKHDAVPASPSLERYPHIECAVRSSPDANPCDRDNDVVVFANDTGRAYPVVSGDDRCKSAVSRVIAQQVLANGHVYGGAASLIAKASIPHDRLAKTLRVYGFTKCVMNDDAIRQWTDGTNGEKGGISPVVAYEHADGSVVRLFTSSVPSLSLREREISARRERHRELAATVIQATYRLYRKRREVARLLHRRDRRAAAVTIQSCFRGWQARRERSRRLHEIQTFCATMIQSLYRGHRACRMYRRSLRPRLIVAHANRRARQRKVFRTVWDAWRAYIRIRHHHQTRTDRQVSIWGYDEAHLHYETKFDAQGIKREEGRDYMAGAYHRWRTRARAFFLWQVFTAHARLPKRYLQPVDADISKS